MLPSAHFFIGVIIVGAIYLIFHLSVKNAFIILVSSILIDLDHFLLPIFKDKNFNLIKIYKESIEKRKKWNKNLKDVKFYPFHGIEFLVLIAVLAFFWKVFFFVFIGILIHLVCDWVDIIYYKKPLFLKTSQIYLYFLKKRLNKY